MLLFNHSDTDFAVAEGDRVAQLVLERIYTPDVLEVAELEESVRGAGGFGSTGGFGIAAAAAVPETASSLDGAADAATTVSGNGGEEEAAKQVDVEMKNGGGEQKSSLS